jgi:signal transduction histidine kinase
MNLKLQYIAAAGLMVVFISNIFAPTEYNIDILYLCSILLVFKERSKIILAFCVAACLLILINCLLFDLDQKEMASLWVNRAISILAILITSYIAIHYRLLNRAGAAKEQEYATALKEMVFITSHQVRKPLANIIGLVESINTDVYHLSQDELKKHCDYLKTSAAELDHLMNDLNRFVEHADKKYQICAQIER